MVKHRALIIGAGRMGSGWGLNNKAHYYVHAKTYKDLAKRVDLVGFVEPNEARADWSAHCWKVKSWPTLDVALSEANADVVSVCTQPDQRNDIIRACIRAGVRGIWCEKPYALPAAASVHVQVNYCRRFDRFHAKVKDFLKEATNSRLVIMAKKDVHTVCHMTDLARWWGVSNFNYVDTPNEPGAYFLRYQLKGIWQELSFPAGGISGDEFMKNALNNLLDAVEGKAELISPPENAIKSEEWANKILEGAL